MYAEMAIIMSEQRETARKDVRALSLGYLFARLRHTGSIAGSCAFGHPGSSIPRRGPQVSHGIAEI